MLIQPDTYIRLIRGCPLDNRYEHTIYFNNLAEQENYFKGLSGVPYNKNSYQRYASGILTIQDKMENIYNCNYLMFRNESFENKWFYAFVTRIEYVNNVTCRVYYELDLMQTWFFDYTLGDCFVEREHSVTDNIGENLVHEDIYFGPYVYGNSATPTRDNLTMEHLSVVIMYNPEILKITETIFEPYTYTKHFYGGAYQGVNFIAIPATANNMDVLNTLISSVDFTSFGGFLSAFVMPTMFLPENKSEYNNYNTRVGFAVGINRDFDGYYPVNNKLFTYPYTCANLTNHRGNGNDFPFEFFPVAPATGLPTATFIATGNLCANPSTMAFPWNYKNVEYFTEGCVSINDYPLCTWGSDGVTEWFNNRFLKDLATIGTIAAIGAVGASVAPAAGVGLSSISPISGQLALGTGNSLMVHGGANMGAFNTAVGGSTIGRALSSIVNTPYGTLAAIGMARSEFDPGTVHGSVGGEIFIGTQGGRKIEARVKHITKKYAQIIDEYFTRFGYATMRLKVPNRNSRRYWNYVKTSGCSITGSIPAEDISSIGSIYDRGITFWKKDAIIGDYINQDNSVYSEGG